ncbi:hypothetical protein MRY87_12940 [bacterium]|nr:hypothetical protein [bacterium]
MTRRGSLFFLVSALCAVLAMADIGWHFVSILRELNPGFDSDEFLHASPAHDLAIALSRADIQGFFLRLQKEVFYPPLHAFILGILFLVTESNAFIARGFSLVLFFLATLLTSFAAYRSLQRNDDKSNGSVRDQCVSVTVPVTLFIGLTCPVGFLLSSLCMLEPLGMFLMGILLVVLCSAKPPYRYAEISALGMVLLLLALTKHTFPILLFPGLFCAALFGDAPREPLFTERERWLFRSFLVFMVFWGLWAISIDGQALYRFLFGHHARGYVIGYRENFSYFLTLFSDFHLTFPLALLSTIFGIIGFFANLNSFPHRVAGFSLIISCLAFGFIAEQGPRHILLLAPCWWFLVAAGFWYCYQRWKRVPSLITIVVFLFSLLSLLYGGEQIRQEFYHTLEAKPDQDEILLRVVDLIPERGKYLLIGDEQIAFPYHLTWLLATRDHLTIPEAGALRQHLNKRERAQVVTAEGAQLESVLLRLQKEKKMDTVVLMRHRGDRTGTPYDVAQKTICARTECQHEEASSAVILSFSLEEAAL